LSGCWTEDIPRGGAHSTPARQGTARGCAVRAKKRMACSFRMVLVPAILARPLELELVQYREWQLPTTSKNQTIQNIHIYVKREYK
jgi:hypothetical protein